MADRIEDIRAVETRPRRNTHDRVAVLESAVEESKEQFQQITMQLGALQSHLMRSLPPDKEIEEQNVLHISEVIDTTEVPDFYIKIIVLGDSAVGKTSYINALYDVPFDMAPKSTISADIRQRNLFISDLLFSVAIWDTAGQEKFRSIVTQYFRQVHGTLLIYDVTDRDSFDHLEDWIDELDSNFEPPILAQSNTTKKRRSSRTNTPADTPTTLANSKKLSKSRDSMANIVVPPIRPIIFLVANKIDMQRERVVTQSEGRRFAKQHNIPYFETSARTKKGIQDVFGYLLASLYKDAQWSLKKSPRKHTPITLEELNEGGRANSGGCCGGSS